MMLSRNHSSVPIRLSPLCALLLSLLASPESGAATQGTPAPSDDMPLAPVVEFDDAALRQISGAPLDISRFNQGNVVLPGKYRAEWYVNNAWLGRTEAELRQVSDDVRNVQPCFNREMLERIGVNLSKLTPEADAQLTDNACAMLSRLIPDAKAVFDPGEQRLDITVPQVAMLRTARGYIDPKYWDEGVPAARLRYNANIYRSDNSGTSTTQGYLGLNAGVNVGPWRLYHTGSLSYSDAVGASSTQYQAIQTNVQRSIVPLKSQLIIGDAFTDGQMFDSFGFRGVQLASDDRMLPDSQRGYAPIVRGIANSNARVQIRQNGNIIYETTVAPGAFEISDLYPTGYGGDLDVIVTEADGSQNISKVPYAAMVNALRPGSMRYSVTGGQYRDASVHVTPAIFQATVQYGFSNLVTGYSGALFSKDYWSVLAGVALNTDYGAIGLDLTQASLQLHDAPSQEGQSVRLSYSKFVASTNTNLAIAAYRYSTRGFLSLSDAMIARDVEDSGQSNLSSPVRGRLQLTLNQALPTGYGSFFASGSTQDYWNRSGRDTQFQAGYTNNYKSFNYGVTAIRQFNTTNNQWDNRVMLTLSVPLGSGVHAPYSNTNVTYDDSSKTTSVQESVSGTLGHDNALTYSVSVGNTSGGNTPSATTGSASVSYIAPIATVSGNVSKGSHYTQAGVGVSGGMIAFPGGAALVANMGETVAIVEATDAAGARVLNQNATYINGQGYAVVSNLTPYALNQIEVDPKGLPLSVELKSTLQSTAPTAGAVVKVKFETDNPGRAAILQTKQINGDPLPFGAEVLDSAGLSVGVVAQGGRVVARGLKNDEGTLIVRWGAKVEQSCMIAYALPKSSDIKNGDFIREEAVCGTGQEPVQAADPATKKVTAQLNQ